MESANKGDIVLYSPGFNSLGPEHSRKERGEKFVNAVRSL
jgi:UDP-N-acetylmuramoylalanine-D-glutamate ligase